LSNEQKNYVFVEKYKKNIYHEKTRKLDKNMTLYVFAKKSSRIYFLLKKLQNRSNIVLLSRNLQKNRFFKKHMANQEMHEIIRFCQTNHKNKVVTK